MSTPTWKPPTDTCCAAGTRSLSPRCARSSSRWTGASLPPNSGFLFEVAQRRQGIDSRRVDDLVDGDALVRAVRHQEGAWTERWYARAAGRLPVGAIGEGGDGAHVDSEFGVARIDPVEDAAAQGHAEVHCRAAGHPGVDRVGWPKL